MRIESSWQVEGGHVRRLGAVKAPSKPPRPKRPRWLVLRLVHEGYATARTIANEARLPLGTTKVHLWALSREGRIKWTKKGWVPA